MNVIARTCSKPTTHLGVLVSGVVVDNKMDIQRLRDRGIDLPQELEKLLMSMASLTGRYYLARGNVKSGKKCCCAMPNVIMSHSLRHSPGPKEAWAVYDPKPESGFSRRHTKPWHYRED